ncbi:AI-2E family transporter [Salinigranum rubrum]|uniref:AI-2E family transporter n=1 Tax=Salinigranum rubrum TaxID=755307 RepID=A0A2I8VNI7_9EURY|nr:AI-2E family transporter [Salinigranum rubrum]AUV83497.1 AI-2E family transporter [Salinigranum rubrum]
MPDSDRLRDSSTTYAHLGWLLFVVGLVASAAFVAWHVVGMVVLGVFGYYAMRPIRDRVESVVESRQVAAVATVLAVLVPVVLLVFYLGVRALSRLQRMSHPLTPASLVDRLNVLGSLTPEQRQQVQTLLSDPTAVLSGSGGALFSNVDLVTQVVGAVTGLLMLLALAVTLSYVLLARDHGLSSTFVDLVGGRDTTVYAYAAAVDEDLESVFFGNFLFAMLMAVVAVVVYWATNLLAPDEMAVPMVLALGLLTGIASLVPIVVGKLVYVPVLAYLGVQALRSGGTELAFVGAVGVVYVLVLDLVPQALVQPYLSGRRLDTTLLLFSFIIGPMVFGWYGFFLLPILMILLLEAVRLVLPELLRGDRPRPSVLVDTDPGTNPREEREDVPDQGEDVEDVPDRGEPVGDVPRQSETADD